MTVVADAGERSGLGHLSRSTAVAVALRCHGVAVECLARGAGAAFERDGVRWAPLPEDVPLPRVPDGLVVDSYSLSPAEVEAATARRLVVLHDGGEVPARADLVVAVAGEPSDGAGRTLGGLAYAALRPAFWGVPPRRVADRVRRVVVSVGGGQLAEAGYELASCVRSALPGASVALVRGPAAFGDVPEGVEPIDAPRSLLGPLLEADLLVTAGGQTLLEAAACGTPTAVVVLAENQRRQAQRLAEAGAARLVDPPDPEQLAAAVSELAGDAAGRDELARSAQLAVDGFGALRVAFHVARLLESAR